VRSVKEQGMSQTMLANEEIIEHWTRGWDEAIEYAIEISKEMRSSNKFDKATLEELEQRIV